MRPILLLLLVACVTIKNITDKLRGVAQEPQFNPTAALVGLGHLLEL